MPTLRALLIEDNPDDALLIERALRRGGYHLTTVRVDNAAGLRAALSPPAAWDVVISDYGLPGFSALEAMQIVKSSIGDVPFVIVSGSIGEESAVEALKAGAGDFIVKTNLDRLLTALDRELRDVQTRRERRDAMAALQEAVRARDEFLAIASHELRTPLTSLQLQLQRLRRKVAVGGEGSRGPTTTAAAVQSPSADDLRARLRSIARSADRLQVLVERLLDVTRLTTVGRIELLVDAADLSELARTAVRRVLATEPEGPAGSIAVRAPAPVPGRWDAKRIEMVIANLVDNALKYGRGRPVEISVEPTGEGGRVTVVDQGIGIPAEDQRRIFERFERAVPVRHFGGFGLGLWLARQIAEAHGGRIKVESRPGQGSTFVLELPRVSASG